MTRGITYGNEERGRDAGNPVSVPGGLFQTLRALRTDPLNWFVSLASEYGDVVRVPFGLRSVVLVADPELARQVFQESDGRTFTKSRYYRKVRSLFGNGLVTSEGETWKKQRKLAQPKFRRDAISGFVGVMAAATERMLDQWEASARSNEARDVFNDMMNLTQAIVVEALFGDDIGDSASEVTVAISAALEHAERRMWQPIDLPDWVPTPGNRRWLGAIRTLEAVVRRIVARRRASGVQRNDLLQMLLDLRYEDGSGLSDSELRDQILTLLVAGHETTGTALGWTLHLLSTRPEIAERVADEARSNPGAPGRLEEHDKLVYTRAVIDETLRYLPPAWTVSRDAVRDCELGPYRIKAGTTVMLCPYVIHRNRRYWNNPEVFDPRRWLDGDGQDAAPRAYFPFGGGPRVCIGQMFALAEMTTVVSSIAKRFALRPVPGVRVKIKPMITLRADPGVPVNIIPVGQ